MRNSLFIIITLLGLSQVNAQGYKNINSSDFNHLVNTKEGIILDVRTPNEYTRGHIKNSTLIDISNPNFVERAMLLQKNKPVYIYCLTGSRSRVAANFLAQQGFADVYNLQAGIIEWQRMGLPIEQSNDVVTSQNKSYTDTEFKAMLTSNDVVLVDFHAPWCAPCKKMAPIIDQLSTEIKGKAKVEKIDIEANKNLQTAYNIQSIPGLVIFKNGKEVWKHTGVISYEELNNQIKKHL